LNQLTTVPSVIFLDVHIKPLDGYAMLKSIREQSRFVNTKVVALTASVMSNEVDYLRKAGFDSLVAKPVNPVSFPTLVNAILSGETVWNITWE
jgi:CheY-like chemotaxis protein